MLRHSNTEGPSWGGFAFLAIIALFVYTWPYSLWLTLLVCFGVGLYLLYGVREKLHGAFLTASNEGRLPDLRRKAAAGCFGLAGIGATMCVFLASTAELIYYLTAEAFLLTAWLHLQMLRAENPTPSGGSLSLLQPVPVTTKTGEGAVKIHSFAYLLYRGARNFCFTAALVAMVFAIGTIYLAQIPSDETILGELRTYEQKLLWARATLEALKLSPLQTFVFLVSLWCLRWIEMKLTKRRRVVDQTWRWAKPTLKLLEKCATVLAVASSLTFLGTGDHGVITKFSARIKMINAEYGDFQRKVKDITDKAITSEVKQRARKEFPVLLKNTVTTAARFMNEFDRYKADVQEASLRYELKDSHPAAIETIPVSHAPKEVSASSLESLRVPDFVSHPSIQMALQKASYLERDIDENEEPGVKENSLGEEAARSTLDVLAPLDKLEDFSAHFAAINEHWPAFAEACATVASALNDWAFKGLWEKFRKGVSEKLLGTSKPIASSDLRREAREIARHANFDWSMYSPGWAAEHEVILEGNRRAVMQADSVLWTASRTAQGQSLQKSAARAREYVGKLRAEGTALSDTGVLSQADRIETALERTLILSEGWPPLRAASSAQMAALREIVRPLEANWSADEASSVRSYPSPQLPDYRVETSGSSALQAAGEWLEVYSRERMLFVVEQHLSSARRSGILERALGRDFTYLKSLHEDRVAKETVRLEEARRQREAEIAARELERKIEIMEERRRIEERREMERMRERPRVEVP